MLKHDAVLDRSMLEPFKIGVVMIDGLEENTSGHISYDRNQNLTLNLTSVLDATGQIRKAKAPTAVRRAVGVLETGEYATLEHVYLSRQNRLSRPGRLVSKSSYRIHRMFVGENILDAEKFDRIAVSFKGLLEWMNQRTVQTKERDFDGEKLVFEYKNPQIPKAMLDDGTTLQMSFAYSYGSSGAPTANFDLPQSVAVGIQAKTPTSFNEMYSKAWQLNRLIALVANTRMPLTSIRVRAGDAVFGVFGKRVAYDTTSVDYFELISYYTDIGESFEDMANSWFAFYKRHTLSLELYFKTWDQQERMDSVMLFLSIIRAVEGFHREDNPNRMKLKERIRDLLKVPYEILEPSTTEEEFVESVVNTRDYHSHGIIQDLEGRIQKFELTKATQRLTLLMHGNMIHALSVPDSLKDKIMARKIRELEQWRAITLS